MYLICLLLPVREIFWYMCVSVSDDGAVRSQRHVVGHGHGHHRVTHVHEGNGHAGQMGRVVVPIAEQWRLLRVCIIGEIYSLNHLSIYKRDSSLYIINRH